MDKPTSNIRLKWNHSVSVRNAWFLTKKSAKGDADWLGGQVWSIAPSVNVPF